MCLSLFTWYRFVETGLARSPFAVGDAAAGVETRQAASLRVICRYSFGLKSSEAEFMQ